MLEQTVAILFFLLSHHWVAAVVAVITKVVFPAALVVVRVVAEAARALQLVQEALVVGLAQE